MMPVVLEDYLQVSKEISSQAPLQLEVYENALLVPVATRGHYRGLKGAVFDAELRPIANSLLTRTWRDGVITQPPDPSTFDPETADVVEEPHLYGGCFFDHYGHFLLESLARAWAVEETGPLPFAWLSGGPPNAWQSDILERLGLTMPHRFPMRPTLFRRLAVPQAGFRIETDFHPRHASFLAKEPSPSRDRSGPRLWLSRGGMGKRGSPGEPELEKELDRRGWRIVRPEDHSPAEQMRLMAEAQVAAGLEGSAFHTAVLLETPPPLIVLRRSTSPSLRTIADRRGFLELDIYGIFRVQNDPKLLFEKDFSLVRPRRWAEKVDAWATNIADRREDPEALAELRAEAEAGHSVEDWRRRQALSTARFKMMVVMRRKFRRARQLLFTAASNAR